VRLKQTGKVALCGMLSALSVVVMLLSYFPSLTYAIPAIAGLFFVILVIEINYKWAFLAYAATSVLVALVAEPSAKLMFIAFFGFYPILKGLIEKIGKIFVEYIIKFAVFNIAIISIFSLLIFIFNMPIEEMGDYGRYTIQILLGLGNITFLLYDFTISRLIMAYMRFLHPKLKKLVR
jgi:hypothetical protein